MNPVVDVMGGVKLPPRELWDCIAFDVVLLEQPMFFGSGSAITLEDVQGTYNISGEVLEHLFFHKDFKTLVQRWKNTIERMGDKAPVILRAQILSSSLTERAYRIAMDKSTDPAQFTKIWELMLVLAGHDVKGKGQSGTPVVNAGGGAIVYVNVPPNIPGMGHVYDGASKEVTKQFMEAPIDVVDIDNEIVERT